MSAGDARFIGEFRLVRKLGEGGMGVVYEAEQQQPRRLVALKVVRGGQHVDEHALKLFQREIQTLALEAVATSCSVYGDASIQAARATAALGWHFSLKGERETALENQRNAMKIASAVRRAFPR